MDEEKQPKISKGGRNLIMLGLSATFIAFLSTVISLVIYHNSGDIYLDRSRPGFLPDEEELQLGENEEKSYDFEKTGIITREVLEEYIMKLEEEQKNIESYSDPFGLDSLSNERLGIPIE